MSEIILTISGIDLVELYGEHDSKLNLIKKAFPDINITSRGESLKLSGQKKDTQKVKSKVEQLVKILRKSDSLPVQKVKDVINGNHAFEIEEGTKEVIDNRTNANVIVYGRSSKPIKARTRNQKKLVDYSEDNDVVFAIGPAGTGKTYTAVALAVRALKTKMVRKIILTRPAVEAGESLGFLPGDLKEKIDPYLRPLYDALHDMLTSDKLDYFIENRIIEVAPLAFMRGRTLDNAFIILDEAQNCTSTQIRMFLTRLGPSAKCIITGDLSQIDLPRNQKSGLGRALDILSDLPGIAKLMLTADDVVRHRLVKDIILRYADSDTREQQKWEEERNVRNAERKLRQEERDRNYRE